MAEYVVTRRFVSFTYPSVLVARVVNAVVGIIEFLLAARFLFEIIGANQSSQFIASIYQITGGLMSPFEGAFPTISFGAFPIDLSILLAMVVYAILAWLIISLFSFMFVTIANV